MLCFIIFFYMNSSTTIIIPVLLDNRNKSKRNIRTNFTHAPKQHTYFHICIHRGTSGFDNSGRGYYFANRQPTNDRPDVESQSFQVSSHYYVPSTHNGSPATTSSSSSSTSSATSGTLNVSPHRLGGGNAISGTRSASPSSPGGSGSGYNLVGRYADTNHRDAFLRADKKVHR